MNISDKKAKRIKASKNKKIQMIFVFLALSTTLWLITKLLNTYTHTVVLNTEYIHLTNDKVLYNKPLDKVDIVMRTTGFNLLLENLFTKKVQIDLNAIQKKGKVYFFVTNDNLPNLQSQFSSDISLLKVYPDTLFFDFGKLASKRIPVRPKLTITYKPGHSLVGDFEIEPKTVLINGAEDEIQAINFIDTKPLKIENVQNDFNYNLNLDIPKEYSKIHFSTKSIEVKGIVEKYTEAQLEIPFELINVPYNYKVKTLIKKVTVSYKVSLENYDKIDETDFKIVCDFNEITNETAFIIPKILKKPNLISQIKIRPNKIEFLIKK